MMDYICVDFLFSLVSDVKAHYRTEIQLLSDIFEVFAESDCKLDLNNLITNK